MTRRRIVVHHFVANLTSRQYGSHPTSDMLGVDYWLAFPPDVEFPVRVGRIDLFTRLYLTNVRRRAFSIEVWHLDQAGYPRERMDVFGPFVVECAAEDDVVDRVFRLTNVPLSLPGQYAIRLMLRCSSRWQEVEWKVVRETHFYVVRS